MSGIDNKPASTASQAEVVLLKSVPLQRQIEILVENATKNIEAAKREIEFHPDRSDEDRIILFKARVAKNQLTMISQNLSRNHVQMTNVMERWIRLLDDPKETVAYMDCDNKLQFNAVAMEAENLALLINRMAENAQALILELESRVNRPTQQLVPKERPNVHLPKLEPIKFDGSPSKWQRFWEFFESTIHQSQLQSVEKMSYLVSFLEKEAKRVADGYDIKGSNYAILIEVLKQRFGKDSLIVESLIREMNQLRPPGNSLKALRSFSIDMDRIRRQLKSLSVEIGTEQMSHMIESKLPRSVLEKLIDRKRSVIVWNADALSETLLNIINDMEEIEVKSADRVLPSKTKALPVQTSEAPKPLIRDCLFCGHSDHRSYQCKAIAEPNERRKKLLDLGRCTRCLKDFKATHGAEKCAAVCFRCKGPHNSLICSFPQPNQSFTTKPTNSNQKTQNKKSNEKIKKQTNKLNLLINADEDSEQSESEAAKSFLSISSKSALPIARITLINPHSLVRKPVYALLDSGSEKSYLTQKVASQLGITEGLDRIITTEVFGGQSLQPIKSKRIKLFVQVQKGHHSISVLTVPRIVDRLCVPIPRGPTYVEKEVEPELLIGADYLFSLLEWRGTQRGDFQEFHTKLGKIVLPIDYEKTDFRPPTFRAYTAKCKEVAGIEDPIKAMWDLELMGIRPETHENVNEEAHSLFLKSIQFENKRYSVQWLWNGKQANLDTNIGIAFHRLVSMMRQLGSNPELKRQYRSIFDEQLSTGIIELVSEKPSKASQLSNHNLPISYLPHQAVINPEKPTTKLRVVFDASAKKKGGLSVNDTMVDGPLFLPQLIGLIFRFRLGKFVVLSDIEKAFLQISLQEDQRDVTRFLLPKNWEKPPDFDNLQVYRFARVCFGVVCSPSILAMTIRHHLSRYPETQHHLQNLYVDNLLQTGDDIETLLKEAIHIKSIFSLCSFNLREHISNHSSINDHFGSKLENPMKFLGIFWDPVEDTISIKIPKWTHQNFTKRNILGFMASIYDPIGLLSPTIIPFKLLLQSLWRNQSPWDDPIGPEFTPQIESILKSWEGMEFSPRKRCISSTKESLSLHIFCDASEKAYGAVAYIVNENRNSHILFSKGRICPLDKTKKITLTIPRKELMGILVAVRMANYIRNEIPNISEIFLWSDSQVCLQQIQNEKEDSVFVRNRLREINLSRHFIEFRHVSTELNPADLISRGSAPLILNQSPLWWEGPDFIRKEKNEWPSLTIIPKLTPPQISETDHEEEITPVFTSVGEESEIFQRFSAYKKLRKFVNIVIRWREKAQKKVGKTNLEKSTDLLIAKALQNLYPPPKKQKLSYQMFQDKTNIWRVKTRLGPEFPDETRFPIWIPTPSWVAKLLILHEHELCLHENAKTVTLNLRTRWWISYRFVKSTVKHCMKCRIHNAQPFEMPTFSPYPTSRSMMGKPFETVGIDIMGPLKSKEAHCYVLLITCLKIRAVHLEITQSMTTEDIVRGLQLFIARRGVPALILSDNAKYFIAGATFFQSLYPKLEWQYITPRAPWQGGIYERLNRNIKEALKRTFGRTRRTLEDYRLLIAKIESSLNNRPLTAVMDDPDNHSILRPVDFIWPQGNPIPEESDPISLEEVDDPEFVLTKTTASELKRFHENTISKLNEFWNRWSKEYLLTLMDKTYPNHSNSSPEPKLGELVIIQKENCPRGEWPLGRIAKLLPSKDGIIRNVELMLPDKSILKRSIHNVCPLEIGGEDPNFGPPITSRQRETTVPRRNPVRAVRQMTTLLVTIMTVLFLFPTAVHSVLWCHGKGPKTIWKLPEVSKCHDDILTPDNLTRKIFRIYKPNHVEYRSDGFLCRFIHKTVYQYRELNGYPRSEEKDGELLEMTADSCELMRKNYDCGKIGHMKKGTHLWQTNNRVNIDPPNRISSMIFGPNKAEKVNCMLMEISVYSHHGSDKAVSSAADLSHCPYRKGSCKTAINEQVFWRVNDTQNCEYIFAAKVEGLGTDRSFVAPKWKLMLTFNPKNVTTDCGKELIITDQGLAIEDVNAVPISRQPLKLPKPAAWISEQLPTPSALVSETTRKKSTLRVPITKKKETTTPSRKFTKYVSKKTQSPVSFSTRPTVTTTTTIPPWRISFATAPTTLSSRTPTAMTNKPTTQTTTLRTSISTTTKLTTAQFPQSRTIESTGTTTTIPPVKPISDYEGRLSRTFFLYQFTSIPSEKFREFGLDSKLYQRSWFEPKLPEKIIVDQPTSEKLIRLLRHMNIERHILKPSNRPKRQLNLEESETAEFQYLEHTLHEVLTLTVHSLCRVMELHAQAIQGYVQSHPTQTLRMILNRTNIIARPLEDAFVEVEFCHEFNKSELIFHPNTLNCSIPVSMVSFPNLILYLDRFSGQLHRDYSMVMEENCGDSIFIEIDNTLFEYQRPTASLKPARTKAETKAAKDAEFSYLQQEEIFSNTIVREVLSTGLQEEILNDMEITNEALSEVASAEQIIPIPSHLAEEVLYSEAYFWVRMTWIVWVSFICGFVTMFPCGIIVRYWIVTRIRKRTADNTKNLVEQRGDPSEGSAQPHIEDPEEFGSGTITRNNRRSSQRSVRFSPVLERTRPLWEAMARFLQRNPANANLGAAFELYDFAEQNAQRHSETDDVASRLFNRQALPQAPEASGNQTK